MTLEAIFPAGLSGLIYDCDGVMIDSAAGNRYLYNAIMAALGLPPLTEEQEKFAFQATFQQALRSLVPSERHGELENAYQTVIDYDRDVLPKIRLMPGYRKFIDEAAQRGLRQAIDTNRTDFGIEKVLDHFQPPPVFEPVISSSVVERPKPAPEGVERICAAWGCAPAQVLFIGDSPDDRAAAKSAGAVFAAFGPGDLSGDLKIANWSALAALLWGYSQSWQQGK